MTPPTTTETEQLSKAQIAYRWIRQRIFTQEFSPGYRLVLATIGDALNMSVVPVREAIRQLEAEGLVTYQRNVGAHVSMVDESQYINSMQTVGILEGAATAAAAPHVSADDLAEARALNAQMQRSLSHFDPASFTKTNQAFHQVLFARCPNQRLTDLVYAEWDRLNHLRESTFSFVPGRATESVAEHAHILDLIAGHASAIEIEQAARDHRNATLTSYLNSPEHQNRSTLGEY
ncbi:GntR family transcriptional regulator [Auritidibacter ignavus]|uniref:GntR family transcriptional regulator n=1 Tax=Auritidibacter ignavus TaxID=678932 RepID=A0AAJ6DBS7_9MICC|nr:GntR family transcriptional regulator [Auritidibacter ignavus]PXA77617.1 GntR family transcriptional regulator [Auritidibacter sp. NML120779]NIH72648.1 DNA-binding GntR family transcriptional regulator [Auritidibacter ignavus]RMX22964.1 GntR family transcriptional regulator [Auritidibacter ignavus]WGH81167.1 GntR family transcriptional regulator [Auritidibacter ignavus]WGH83150.1 GntR family transcriptional regulator [Auritidibacter ignavus]